MTGHDHAARLDHLHAMMDGKIDALIREMEDAGFAREDIVTVMRDAIHTRRPDQSHALRQARETVARGDFVSDGNEG